MVRCSGRSVPPHTAVWCYFLFQSLPVGSPWNDHGDWSGVIWILQFGVTWSPPYPAVDSTDVTCFCKSLSVQLTPCSTILCACYMINTYLLGSEINCFHSNSWPLKMQSLWNCKFKNYLPSNTASHPERPESSLTLRENLKSHNDIQGMSRK